jgi:hypothetical protein
MQESAEDFITGQRKPRPARLLANGSRKCMALSPIVVVIRCVRSYRVKTVC